MLLFGAGASVGWGVTSHDLALPGTLARALSRLTGRGADVDVLSDPRFMAATAIDDLRAVNLGRYDAILLTVGLNEAAQLSPVTAWRHDLDGLLDYVAERKHPNARVFVLGIHRLTRMTWFDTLMLPITSGHRRAMNRTTRALTTREDRAIFLPFDPPRSSTPSRSRTSNDYRSGAAHIAPGMATVLDRAFAASTPESRDERARDHDEAVRQAAVDSMIPLDGADARFDRLVALAQQVFGATSAAITVIDGDRQLLKSGRGDAYEIDRASSICNVTIGQAGALVIGDVTLDERFVALTESDVPTVRFYAGFPIEGPTGERIGALCVFDGEARDANTVDRVLLRDLALQVQREVWMSAARSWSE